MGTFQVNCGVAFVAAQRTFWQEYVDFLIVFVFKVIVEVTVMTEGFATFFTFYA